MKEIRKTTKTFKKLTIMSCMMLTLCLAASACGGKDEAEGTKDTVMGFGHAVGSLGVTVPLE